MLPMPRELRYCHSMAALLQAIADGALPIAVKDQLHPVRLRCGCPGCRGCREAGCDRILSTLNAHPTVTAFNIIGDNHRLDESDSRATTVSYDWSSHPHSYGVDQLVWRCEKCGREVKRNDGKVQTAYLKACDSGHRDITLGIDL